MSEPRAEQMAELRLYDYDRATFVRPPVRLVERHLEQAVSPLQVQAIGRWLQVTIDSTERDALLFRLPLSGWVTSNAFDRSIDFTQPNGEWRVYLTRWSEQLVVDEAGPRETIHAEYLVEENGLLSG